MPRVVQYYRQGEFFSNYFDWRPGEHISLIQPTGGGKTYTAYQAGDQILREYPSQRFVSLNPKIDDESTRDWAARLDLKIIESWPPKRELPWKTQPRGYVFWPKHLKDVDAQENRIYLSDQFRACLKDQYFDGDTVTLCDDIYIIAVLMKLNMELEEFWTAGRSNGSALISCNQKPSGTKGGGSVSSFSYNSPTHMILGKDTDENNIDRFGDIGMGIDKRIIEKIVRNLKMTRIGDNNVSDQLYLHRGGPYAAILQP